MQDAERATPRTGSPPMMLRRPYRTSLRRELGADGETVWIAEVVDMPWCRGTGATRMEALRAVRAVMHPRVPRA
jgi:hypothetical protein